MQSNVAILRATMDLVFRAGGRVVIERKSLQRIFDACLVLVDVISYAAISSEVHDDRSANWSRGDCWLELRCGL